MELPDDNARPDRVRALVVEVVEDLLAQGDLLRPLDVLLALEIVTPEAVEGWMAGKLPYLERAMTAGLSRVARMLRIVREHALANGLVPAPGKYTRRGSKKSLRFSKRGDANSEASYRCHFVRPGGARTVRELNAP